MTLIRRLRMEILASSAARQAFYLLTERAFAVNLAVEYFNLHTASARLANFQTKQTAKASTLADCRLALAKAPIRRMVG